MRAALGVRAHTGWAAVILLGGSPAAPRLLHRGRIELCDGAIAGSKQLFHAAEPMAFARAEAFVARCTAATAQLAARAVGELAATAKAGGAKLDACTVLTASGRALPPLQQILASHALIHAAEGELYRDAVAAACAHAGISARKIKERELAGAAAARLALSDGKLQQTIAALGRPLGPPWTADQKLSTLAAWLALAS